MKFLRKLSQPQSKDKHNLISKLNNVQDVTNPHSYCHPITQYTQLPQYSLNNRGINIVTLSHRL